MRCLGSHAWLTSTAVVAGAIASAAVLISVSPPAEAHIRTECTPASGAPCPTPTPTSPSSPSPNPNAYLTLDVTSGGPDTLITVSGSLFLPNQSISLYWDQSNRVSGAADADSHGNFTWKVKPFPGDPPGVHKLCASVAPNPCASFTLVAPIATPSPSPSPSPEPSSSPPGAATPARINSKLNGLDVILRPPFVILPIIGGVGLAIALMYWILSIVMRPRQQTLKSVTVGHLASRPDYSAPFGAAPPAPAAAAPMPSAWDDVARSNVAPPADASAEEAELPPEPREMTQDAAASNDEVQAAGTSAETATPAPAGTGDLTDESDPLLAAWADVLPPRTEPVDAPPRDGEDTPKRGPKPRGSHDDPLDFPEPSD
jgi:hypothetical protein